PRLTDLAPEEYAPYIGALATVCRRAERLSPDYNVTLNQGAAAGQIVFHLHFHVIPRYGEANPFNPSARKRLSEEEARALVAELSPP
ncbi:histidine triad (HIT) protein, partial [mine drainage metagenome]